MDEYNNNNLNDEEIHETPQNQEEFEQQSDNFFDDFKEETVEEPVFSNPINYSDVVEIKDYKPMNKGLKIFAVSMLALMVISASCLAGYFLSQTKTTVQNDSKVDVELASKPKDSDGYSPAKIYDMLNESVVGIYIYNTDGNASQASGVIYSEDGYIVTNDHIYSEISSPQFKIFTADGKEYDAKYVAGDTISDLAVLKVDGVKFDAAEFGNSDELIYGESVVAIGRPNNAIDPSSITSGIISATKRRVQTTSSYSASLIQTDSAINPGSSGGALVNMYGQIVGITSSKLAGVEYDAVGYAIPTVTVKRVVEELISEGKVVSRAKLGISYTAINSVTAEINGLDYTGLSVADVSEDSDVYGKLKVGDVITHVNGIEIVNDKVILDIIEESRAGDKITITVVSKMGNSNDYEVTLKPNIGESSYTTQKNESESKSEYNGTFDFPFGE